MNSIFLMMILLLSFVIHISGFFRSHSKFQTVLPILSKECCIPPKINVNPKRANHGKDFLRQLTINSDLYEEANPENMCNLMHFLFQQASINKKSIPFTEGMFILFDSSNLVFDRLIKAQKHQQHSNRTNFRNHLHPVNPLKYIGRRNVNPQTNENFNERYPIYGIDIPGSCLPSSFDHILFGELPPFLHDYKYNGRRIFIKPDHFGFETIKISSAINNVNSFIKQLVKQELCRLMKGETKAECAKLRAFKENTDKILLKKWINILSNLPSKWNIYKQYKERAIKYGIREIDQQSKDLEAAGVGKDVKKFRKLLIQQYGQDDIRVRKGREIIFTITELKQSHLTCQSSKDVKCVF